MTDHTAFDETVRAELAPGLEILRPLGRGSMAHVYQAREPALKRLVAIKVLRPELASDPIAVGRFEREAQSVAQISHAHVAGVYRVGRLSAGVPYLVMEYIDGRNISDALKAEGPLPVEEARRVLGDLARALEAAHAKGIIHRDVRPANVLRETKSGRVVLTDFGIAAVLATGVGGDAPKLTMTGQLLGDIGHMSPEHLRGEPVTEQADIYSLGILGYELLTGAGPYEIRSEVEAATAHLRQTPRRLMDLREDVDPGLADLLERCLAKQPQHRPTAADVARALEAEGGVEGVLTDQGPQSAWGRFLRELKRRRVMRVAAGYVLATVLAAADTGAFILEVLGVPNPEAAARALVAVLLAAFPLVLVLAWMFDLSRRGVVRTAAAEEVDRRLAMRTRALQALGLALSLALSLLIGWILLA